MKYLYSIYVWILGGFMFLVTAILVFLLRIFLKPKNLNCFAKILFKVILTVTFLKPIIIYEERFDKSKAYIYMPNHVSMMDVFMMASFTPTLSIGIEAHTHFKWPIYGWFIKILNQIPINRTSVRESLFSFEKAKQMINKKWSIVIYPEGTRSVTGQLKDFKKMPFKFAKETSNDIVPVCFIGIQNIAPEKSPFFKPYKVKMIIGKPISNDLIANLSVEQLLEKVRNEIIRMSENY